MFSVDTVRSPIDGVGENRVFRACNRLPLPSSCVRRTTRIIYIHVLYAERHVLLSCSLSGVDFCARAVRDAFNGHRGPAGRFTCSFRAYAHIPRAAQRSPRSYYNNNHPVNTCPVIPQSSRIL